MTAAHLEYLGLKDFTNDYGIDELEIMIKFIGVIESNTSKLDSNFNKLKSYLVSQLKRGITPEEELNLSKGMLDYSQSDPGTPDRMSAMNYLFTLKFLTT